MKILMGSHHWSRMSFFPGLGMAELLCGVLGEGPLPLWLLVTCPGHCCASLCVSGILASKLSRPPGWVAMVSLLSRFHAIEIHFSHA